MTNKRLKKIHRSDFIRDFASYLPLKFYNHVGPGHGDPALPPMNDLDHIAKKHDAMYDRGEYDAADEWMIKELDKYQANNPWDFDNVLAIAAKYGLRLKRMLNPPDQTFTEATYSDDTIINPKYRSALEASERQLSADKARSDNFVMNYPPSNELWDSDVLRQYLIANPDFTRNFLSSLEHNTNLQHGPNHRNGVAEVMDLTDSVRFDEDAMFQPNVNIQAIDNRRNAYFSSLSEAIKKTMDANKFDLDFDQLQLDSLKNNPMIETTKTLNPSQPFVHPSGPYDFSYNPLVGVELNPGPPKTNKPVSKSARRRMKKQAKKVASKVEKKVEKAVVKHARSQPLSRPMPHLPLSFPSRSIPIGNTGFARLGSALISTAGPAAVGYGAQQVGDLSSGAGRTVTTQQEMIGSLLSSQNFRITKFALNPGLRSVFANGYRRARMFDHYRINNLTVQVLPTGGTNVTGSVGTYFDYDVADLSVSDVQTAFNNLGCAMNDAWHTTINHFERSRVSIPNKKFLVRSDEDSFSASGASLSDSDCVNLYIFTDGFANNTTIIGKIVLQYEIEYFNPHLRDDKLIDITWSTGNNGTITFGLETGGTWWSGAGAGRCIVWNPYSLVPSEVNLGPCTQGSDWRSTLMFGLANDATFSPAYNNQFSGTAFSTLTAGQIAIAQDGIYQITVQYKDSATYWSAAVQANLSGPGSFSPFVVPIAPVVIPPVDSGWLTIGASAAGENRATFYNFKVVGATQQNPAIMTFTGTRNAPGATTTACGVWRLKQTSKLTTPAFMSSANYTLAGPTNDYLQNQIYELRNALSAMSVDAHKIVEEKSDSDDEMLLVRKKKQPIN